MTKIATRAKQYDLYIDGRWTAGTGTEVISVVNPATEEEIGSAPMGSVADTVHSIEAARRAFDEGPWPRMSPRHGRSRQEDPVPREASMTAQQTSVTEGDIR
jgi:Aldehyde dehydrogenase family